MDNTPNKNNFNNPSKDNEEIIEGRSYTKNKGKYNTNLKYELLPDNYNKYDYNFKLIIVGDSSK